MELNIELKKIIEALGEGECSLDPSFVINHITSLEKAGPHDLAILVDRGDQSVFDAMPREKIQQSGAGLFLAEKPIVEGKNYLIVKDPLGAFQKLVAFVERHDDKHLFAGAMSFSWVSKEAFIAEQVFIAPSAVVSAGAHIGRGTIIGDHVFIGKNCVIGAGVMLHPGVKILDRCVVGDYSIIHAGAVIGSDGFGYQVGLRGLRKIPQIGIVRIGKQVEIGANCTIDRASFEETVVEDFVKIDNSVHIAHNVKIGTGTAILAQTGIAGSVVIGRGCQIGGHVAIRDHINIGNGAKIVSKAGVMHDIKDGEVVAGIPAVQFNQWKRMVVMLAKLPEIFKVTREVTELLEKRRSHKSWWQKLFS